MGIHDREYYQGERSRPGVALGQYSMVTLLVAANAVVFLLDMFGENHALMRGMAVQSVTLVEPWNWWRFLTAGFAHDPQSVNHLIFNMAGLWFLGRPVEERYGKREFLLFYLVAIVLGNLIWSAHAYYELGHIKVPETALGASGGVTAVVMLFIFLYPRQTLLLFFVLPVPAWAVGVLLVVMNLLQINTTGVKDARVAYDIHLVGIALGAIYYKCGWNFSRWIPGQRAGTGKSLVATPTLKAPCPRR